LIIPSLLITIYPPRAPSPLRRADFSDNELARISGLDALARLEWLSLEDNRLSRVEGLTRLTALRTLDLGRNRITRLDELGTRQMGRCLLVGRSVGRSVRDASFNDKHSICFCAKLRLFPARATEFGSNIKR
jgi:Leucine-rich repeat (LRR) protein